MRSFPAEGEGRGGGGKTAGRASSSSSGASGQTGGGDGWGEGGESSAGGAAVRLSRFRSSGGVVGEETTHMGEKYLVADGGDKFIAASKRSDGSNRKQIRVRMGFVPTEEQSKFRSKLEESREKTLQETASRGGPPGWYPPADKETSSKTTASKQSKTTNKEMKKTATAGSATDELASQFGSKVCLEDNDDKRSKRLRGLRKKLREIDVLEESLRGRAADQQTTTEQQQKLDRKDDIVKEIEQLQAAES
eukprot:GHVS01008214.1.p1 GENE.GHVS01008214.1~~GHVS01008214.1.p1  ORF type:complete len:249 (+),score=72.88 GHVS01008214.1:49-795(+)